MKLTKGEMPRDLDAACGGPTLERVRSFVKGEETEIGPCNKQDYTKGSSKGVSKRAGGKELPLP